MATTKVNTPNGIIEVEHPDGATEDQILRFAMQQTSAPKYGGFVDEAIGLGDAALTIGSGLVGQSVGGLAGIAAHLDPSFTSDEAVDYAKKAQDFISVGPFTETGERTLRGISEPLAAVGNKAVAGLAGLATLPFQGVDAAVDTINQVQDQGAQSYLGNLGYEQFGPVGGAVGETLPTAALYAPVLARHIPGVGKPSALTTRQTVFQNGRAHGYRAPPHSVNPKARTAGVLEGAGGRLKTRQTIRMNNQRVTDSLAARSLGWADDTPITVDNLSALRAEVGQVYNTVRNYGRIPRDTAFRSSMANITAPFRALANEFKNISQATQAKVLSFADDFNKPTFSSNAAVDAIEFLRNEANIAFRAGNNKVGFAYRDMSVAIEQAIERGIARTGGGNDLVASLRNARQTIARTYSIQDALDGTSVNATQLASQLKRGQPLTGELRDIAEFATEFRPYMTLTKEAPPPISPLDMITPAVMAGGAIATGNPWVALPGALPFVRPALRSTATSNVAQYAAGAARPASRIGMGGTVGPGILGEMINDRNGLLGPRR